MSAPSRPPRSVPVPTGRAALLVLVAALPAVLARAADWWTLALGGGLVVGLLVRDLVRAANPTRIDVRRRLPPSVQVGNTVRGGWTIVFRRADAAAPERGARGDDGTRRSPTRIEVRDALWPSLGATQLGDVVRLRPGGVARVATLLTPTRRGRFPLGPVTVRVTGPLGLVVRQQTRLDPGAIVVLPAYRSRDRVAAVRRVPLDTGLRAVRARGTGTDFDQLREYRPGDDFRRVDWAATARSQRAVVREYRAERNQHVIALLDNGRTMAATVGGVPRVELAMDAVLALTDVAVRLGDNIGLVTFDNQVRGIVPPRTGSAQFTRVAEAMYLLDPQYDESAYEPALRAAAARFRRRSLFVVFTDISEALVWDSLEPAVAAIGRTHLVLVAAVQDPLVAAWARDPVGSRPVGSGPVGRSRAIEDVDPVDAAYRSSAAVMTLDDRERAAARLRAVGAVVVDAVPDELAVRVVEVYLELKASGRL